MLAWWLLRLLLGRGEPASTSAGCGRCGCQEDAHEHYRPGRDCGHCGARRCPRFVGRFGGAVRLTVDVARLLASR